MSSHFTSIEMRIGEIGSGSMGVRFNPMRGSFRQPGRLVFLLVMGAITGIVAEEGDLRLVHAARVQDVSTVRALLNQRMPVDVAQPDGATSLHWAAHWNNLDMADALLSAGADVNVTNQLGVTPLSLACTNGSAAIVERLLANGAHVNLALPTGVTPLMMCARSGSVDAVRHLLAAGATVNVYETVRGQTALMWAVAEKHAPVTEALIAAGADGNVKSKSGFTPLLFSAQQGDQQSARILLENGVDINEVGGDGSGALLVATESSHADMVRFLIEAGADVDMNDAGRSALHASVQHERLDIAMLLLSAGADPNLRLTSRLPRFAGDLSATTGPLSPIGATPFWLASKFADMEMMHLLMNYGADPIAMSDDGTTPLMVAAGIGFLEGYDRYGRLMFNDDTERRQQHDLETVELALSLGGEVDTINEYGQTAMHGAAYSGNNLIVQLLVDEGALIDVVDKNGREPVTIADGMWVSGTFVVREATAALLRKLGKEEGGQQ